jgi:TldD protein
MAPSFTRRDVLKAVATTSAALPAARALAWVPDRPSPKSVAEAALSAAKAGGAEYADMRLVRISNETVNTRDDHVVSINRNDSFGVGVRVLRKGTWGFAASADVSPEGAKTLARRALAIAEANAVLQSRPVELAPEPPHQDSWQTPIEKDPGRVPLEAKTSMLLEANRSARTIPGVRAFFGNYLGALEEKAFFSSEGSVIEQMIHRIAAGYRITVIDEKKGDFESRNFLAPGRSAGFEYVESLGLVESAPKLAQEAKDKLAADRPVSGPRDLILDPSNMWLTIHESVGHATELDRVLGYEANFAGTSFVQPTDLGRLSYATPAATFFADRTTPGGLATCGYDDDGVKTGRWDLIRDGVLVGFQTIRDQKGLPGFGGPRSSGACYADSWASVPFQRMPNVSLAPSKAPMTLSQLIATTADGIYVIGNGSWSIDHQRKNFQFGGDFFWEVKNGKLVRPLRDVAYQANTLDFWHKLDGHGGQDEWRLYGAMNDGKGEPGQTNAVSHGCPPARFRQVNVLDASRNRSGA